MTTTVFPKLTTREGLKRLGLLPRSGMRAALYGAALRELDLTVIDYQTISDIVELANLGDDPAAEAALIALFDARNEGSLCVRAEAESLYRRLPEFAGREELVARFLANLHDGVYDTALVGRDETAFKPVILRGEFLYFQRYLYDECRLRDSLQAWLAESSTIKPQDHATLRAIIAQVLDNPSLLPDGKPISLNPEQQLALVLALLQSFTVVTGGPGTGKTAIIMAILRCLVRMGIAVERIALTAPTGRAAQRMSESLREQLVSLPTRTQVEEPLAELGGQTIHRLLGYSPSRNTFTFGKDNPLAVDAVVVDEVSMIDVTLMARLLDATPPGAKLILLGDAQQLPSVEAGAVLADLAPSERKLQYSPEMVAAVRVILPCVPAITPTPGPASLLTDHVVRLLHSHRSAPGIQAVAAVVNEFTDGREGELFTLLTAGGANCTWEDAAGETAPKWQAHLDSWAKEHYLQSALYTALQHFHAPNALTSMPCDATLAAILRQITQAKILTAVHEGRYGCDGINAYLTNIVRKHLDPGSHGHYFAGAPIMITRNDYTLELFNGDTGVILRDAAGSYHVAFPRGKEVMLVPLDSLPEHTLAFAITVHKSQGSEYEHVLLVLPNTESSAVRRLLTREIIYTGLTRAKQTAAIHGSRDVLLQACRSRVERESGLSFCDVIDENDYYPVMSHRAD